MAKILKTVRGGIQDRRAQDRRGRQGGSVDRGCGSAGRPAVARSPAVAAPWFASAAGDELVRVLNEPASAFARLLKAKAKGDAGAAAKLQRKRRLLRAERSRSAAPEAKRRGTRGGSKHRRRSRSPRGSAPPSKRRSQRKLQRRTTPENRDGAQLTTISRRRGWRSEQQQTTLSEPTAVGCNSPEASGGGESRGK